MDSVTEEGPMTREELMKKLASNPRFKEAEKSGRAYIIPGAKQPGASSIPEVPVRPEPK
jgi:hypothetical protein